MLLHFERESQRETAGLFPLAVLFGCRVDAMLCRFAFSLSVETRYIYIDVYIFIILIKMGINCLSLLERQKISWSKDWTMGQYFTLLDH
jgi:hypothetical protein